MYYDYSKILSYNALLNFLIGERRRSGKLMVQLNLLLNNLLKRMNNFVTLEDIKAI